ncbi:MAG TPA: MBL fold metallo-hydrolase [Halanaerobiales bacterium]|nr:MBL fold metallo-hydrolase [Halanaerobiales bacterium]HPZ62030.1 MBL fold metallo-hydrolase [Halanaerobiales bacterium]HQD03246.1 MBL fold metallo-hydrolase [Halanaerobiales bacterium]
MNKKYPLTISFFLLLLLVGFSVAGTSGELIIHYLDLGQADSILLELPNNEIMLIDAGNNSDGQKLVNYLREQGIDTIDYLIGTHPHADHIGGLDDVIENFVIGRIYMPEVIHTTKTFEDVLLAVQRKGKKITPARTGVSIIDDPVLQIYFLSPINNNYKDLNHYSAVVKVDFLDKSFLFTGDAEKINEEEMIEKYGVRLKSHILKVGHHGSNTSTSEEFIEKVVPDYAVISVGKDNSYGHPSALVIQRLQNHGVKIYRTDLQGTIIARSDGQQILFNQDPVNQNITGNHGIIIESVDLVKEMVIIRNNSNETVNLSRWRLVSVVGNQEFIFPQGTLIRPGERLKIVSGSAASNIDENTMLWTKSYIWNNDGDPAELYDDKNNLIATY